MAQATLGTATIHAAEEYTVGDEPYYLPIADEVELFAEGGHLRQLGRDGRKGGLVLDADEQEGVAGVDEAGVAEQAFF